MQVDYSALTETAASLSGAATQVSEEPHASPTLGSGAANAERAHEAAAGARTMTLTELGTLLRAQSQACTEMVTLFRALDAQIAAVVPLSQ